MQGGGQQKPARSEQLDPSLPPPPALNDWVQAMKNGLSAKVPGVEKVRLDRDFVAQLCQRGRNLFDLEFESVAPHQVSRMDVSAVTVHRFRIQNLSVVMYEDEMPFSTPIVEAAILTSKGPFPFYFASETEAAWRIGATEVMISVIWLSLKVLGVPQPTKTGVRAKDIREEADMCALSPHPVQALMNWQSTAMGEATWLGRVKCP